MDNTNVIKEEEEEEENEEEYLDEFPQSVTKSVRPASPGGEETSISSLMSSSPTSLTHRPEKKKPTAESSEPAARRGSKKSIKRQPSFIQSTADKLQTISQRIKLSNQLNSAKRIDETSLCGGVLGEQPHPIQMPDIPLTEPTIKTHREETQTSAFINTPATTCNDYDTQGNTFFDASNELDESFNMEGIISGGNLKFSNHINKSTVVRPYLHVMHHAQAENVVQLMLTKWKLPTPRIVLCMVTNIGDLRSWGNARQMVSFQKGLMKAANTTSMWMVTNGLDVGLSQLIGEAIEKETEELRTFRYLEKTRQPFNVIGMANEANLSYNQDFFGREVELSVTGPIESENRFELNQQHTHFVVMKESQANEDNTSSFLINFIDYLTKRNERSAEKTTNLCDDLEEDDGPLFQGDSNLSNYSTISGYYYGAQSNRPTVMPQEQHFPRPSGGTGSMMVTEVSNQHDQTDKPWKKQGDGEPQTTETYYDTVSFVSKEGKVEVEPLIARKATPGQEKGCGKVSKGKFDIEASTRLENTLIPVVCVVIKGGYSCARLVLDNLRRHNPVIVFRGTGGLADLLSFVFVEMQTRCRDIYTSWDAEFVEHTLKPLLTTKIVKRFPRMRNNAMARNILRDRIIDCVRQSGSPRGRVYLSILNVNNSSCNLENLSEFILFSLFKSQNRKDTLDANLLRKDLFLTLDWNCAHVALDEVLRRNPSYHLQLEKVIFEMALLRENREDFVDLFLSHGFKIHKYLTPFRLKRLIKHSLQSQEFFRTVCMENIIGIAVWSVNFDEMLDRLEVDFDSFAAKEFNQLIFTTTHMRAFVNPEHLYLNIMGMYAEDEQSAERKSIAILAMWAVFNKRFKLAEVIWKHSDQPIHLALVLSMMLERLAWFVSEHYLKEELQEHSKTFAKYGLLVIDACYQKDERRAYELLSQESSDWDRKTAVDIAANGSHRAFIGHPCCQKWLTNMFNGRIRIRELTWGIFTVPPVLKVILSAFFIFPMYFWIRFLDEKGPTLWHKKGLTERVFYEESDMEDDLNVEKFKLTQMSQSGQMESGEGVRDTLARRRKNNASKEQDYYFYRQKRFFLRKQPPLWTMIHQLWSAPITKFWTYQVFYILYLIILSLATIWPGCGNRYLDFTVILWTFLSLIEQSQRSFRLYRKYTSVPMFFRILEILGIIIFCSIYFCGRLWNPLGLPVSPYTMKVVLCLGVLYFYYRLFAIHLPISPTLGPLLYRFKLMVTVDFAHFMRMALILLLSSGITIQAILYPNTELSGATFHKAFHRTIISLFLTPVDELIEKCNKTSPAWTNINATNIILNETKSLETRSFLDKIRNNPVFREGTCPTHPKTMAESCPQTGFWPYLFSFQFLIFLKLILLTLLYALFANTASKLQSETDNIWKFQRYLLVIDFATRPALHAPLSAFGYAWRILCCLVNMLKCWNCRPCLAWCRKDRVHGKVFRAATDTRHDDSSQKLTREDYNFWRYLARTTYEKQRNRPKEEETLAKQTELLQSIVEEIEKTNHTVRTIKTKMAEMEHKLYEANISLESIKHSTFVGATVAGGGKFRGTVLVGTETTGPSHVTSPMTPAAHMQLMTSSASGTQHSMASFYGHVHLLSRHSPYVGTQIQRFPIADKFVSWDVIWINYDPVTFSRKREDFPHTLQAFVDEDILAIKSRMLRVGKLDGQMHLPVFNWNALSLNPAGLTIDRKSWLSTTNKTTGLDFDLEQQETTLVYKLDDGIPLNPFGRTGLRGKGNLPRWGPNHYVMLIVTRTKQLFGTALMLQFALEHRNGQLALPMRFIGGESLFGDLEKLFAPLEANWRQAWNDREAMFEYFRSKCAFLKTPRPHPKTTVDGLAASRLALDRSDRSTGKSASTSNMFARSSPTLSMGAMSMLGSMSLEHDEQTAVRFDADYVQYIDSLDNTDNAWKEGRIFHVHFNQCTPTTVSDNLFAPACSGTPTMIWMGATEELLIRLPTEQVPFMNGIVRRFEVGMRPNQQRE